MPDVWIPDSSTWLARLSLALPDLDAAEAASIARSPVVVAMPEPVADQRRLADGEADLGGPAAADDRRHQAESRHGRADPRRRGPVRPAGLRRRRAGEPGRRRPPRPAALRALATGRSVVKQDLLARFPRSADPAAIASGLSAAALSEQAVIAYNAAKPPVKLAALYVEPAPVALDYPFAVLPGNNLAKSDAATALRKALQQKPFLRQARRRRPARAGRHHRPRLRRPHRRTRRRPPPRPPSAGQRSAIATAVDQALSTWIAVTLPSRMLAIIDVSGSMLQKVAHRRRRDPGPGDARGGTARPRPVRRLVGRRPVDLLHQPQRQQGLSTSRSRSGRCRRSAPRCSRRSARSSPCRRATPVCTTRSWPRTRRSRRTGTPAGSTPIVMMTDGDNDDPSGGVTHEQLLAQAPAAARPAEADPGDHHRHRPDGQRRRRWSRSPRPPVAACSSPRTRRRSARSS